jgi:hypothetical protein
VSSRDRAAAEVGWVDKGGGSRARGEEEGKKKRSNETKT